MQYDSGCCIRLYEILRNNKDLLSTCICVCYLLIEFGGCSVTECVVVQHSMQLDWYNAYYCFYACR